jgi:3-oxoacyl-[acyl-carrier protein] reductase
LSQVFLGYTSESSAAKVEEVIKRIQALPHQPQAHVVKANLGELDGPAMFVDQLRAVTSGEPKIDILVNNAGMGGGKPLAELTPDFYDAIFNVNVKGLLFLTQAIQPFLQPKARIINLSSVGARLGRAGGNVYSASKAAVEALTRSMAAELGVTGTTVNAVSPGPVPSDMMENTMSKDFLKTIMAQTPIERRLPTEEEVPNIIAWLASPAASWVTGQCINASGGFQMI